MHHAPTDLELEALTKASHAERLDYFINHAMESEEVWGLATDAGWLLREQDALSFLPVWPYAILSRSYAKHEWPDHAPDAVSLEHFIFNILKQLGEQDIQVEIIPSPQQAGLLIEAKALFEIFERKLDTVEYFLEG